MKERDCVSEEKGNCPYLEIGQLVVNIARTRGCSAFSRVGVKTLAMSACKSAREKERRRKRDVAATLFVFHNVCSFYNVDLCYVGDQSVTAKRARERERKRKRERKRERKQRHQLIVGRSLPILSLSLSRSAAHETAQYTSIVDDVRQTAGTSADRAFDRGNKKKIDDKAHRSSFRPSFPSLRFHYFTF